MILVLILVVMDDALVLQILVYSTTLQSVLILVVMDDALVQDFVYITIIALIVLILVVMDDALVLSVASNFARVFES